MKCLLDTHAFIWYLLGDPNLAIKIMLGFVALSQPTRFAIAKHGKGTPP